MGAWYNTRTKQIEGARPGTLFYFHEERHAWQDKHGLLDIANYLYFLAAPITILSLMFAPTYTAMALFPIGIHFAYTVGIEIDAWIYAFGKEESNYGTPL